MILVWTSSLDGPKSKPSSPERLLIYMLDRSACKARNNSKRESGSFLSVQPPVISLVVSHSEISTTLPCAHLSLAEISLQSALSITCSTAQYKIIPYVSSLCQQISFQIVKYSLWLSLNQNQSNRSWVHLRMIIICFICDGSQSDRIELKFGPETILHDGIVLFVV